MLKLGRYWPWNTVSSHLNTKELKFYSTITSIQMGFYAKWLMVEGSSFFLIINDVIITSIPLFKIINVLNHFMILSTSSYFSTYNAFRFVAILGKEWWSIWVHGFIMMSTFVMVSINYTETLTMMDNSVLFSVLSLWPHLPWGEVLKFKRRALKGPTDVWTLCLKMPRLHYQPLFRIWACAPQTKKLDLFSGKNKSGAKRTRKIESNKCPAWKGLINSKIDLF